MVQTQRLQFVIYVSYFKPVVWDFIHINKLTFLSGPLVHILLVRVITIR